MEKKIQEVAQAVGSIDVLAGHQVAGGAEAVAGKIEYGIIRRREQGGPVGCQQDLFRGQLPDVVVDHDGEVTGN